MTVVTLVLGTGLLTLAIAARYTERIGCVHHARCARAAQTRAIPIKNPPPYPLFVAAVQGQLASVFMLTLFVSAWLLFMVQPMFARMALPLLGGSPSVWNVCVLFFQAGVLLGYLYAHLAATRLRLPQQIAVQAVVLLIPLLVLPIAIAPDVQAPLSANHTPWLLLLLATSVGLPLFAVSSTAPLLQRWFSLSQHRDAHDPYFLYAASNLGSIAALLLYPTVIEPQLALGEQSAVWAGGFAVLIALSLACAYAVWSSQRSAEILPHAQAAPTPVSRVTGWQRARWIAFAFVPSSLMLGVTTFITTDVAAVPLLWVAPLVLYLLTFVITFARRPLLSHVAAARALPMLAVASVTLLLMGAQEPIALVELVHLATLFVAALVCHGELARTRPHAQHLTEFYVVMSIGGILGGVFNALVAPLVFASISEYPLMIVMACLLCPAAARAVTRHRASESPAVLRASDLVWPLLVGLATVALVTLGERVLPAQPTARVLLAAGLPALACYLMSKRPLRFGLGLSAVLLANAFAGSERGTPLMAERTFFGVHRVTHVQRASGDTNRDTAVNLLYHGTTLHGEQDVDLATGTPANARSPLAYYHRNGPLGDVFATYGAGLDSIGIVGLGTGAAAAYSRPGQRYEFFEIDPTVVQIAEDRRYFTYLAAARERGTDVQVTLGDARLALERTEGARFDLLVLDAFSSDAIPMHLLTREAIEIYLRTLRPDGLLVMHLSNRHLELAPIVSRLAGELGLSVALRRDGTTAPDPITGAPRRVSEWAVVSRSPQQLNALASTRRDAWFKLPVDPTATLWTDDYSNLLQAIVW